MKFLSALLVCVCAASSAVAQVPIEDAWKMLLRKPPAGWQQPGFDDGDWQTSHGGFGTRDTPGARVGTVWQTNQIWLRKSFELASLPSQPALLMHHDEDAEVFLNGKKVADVDGWTTAYQVVPLTEEARAALRVGQNTLAVHCRQTGGGQFIDVHLIDAEHVPELPPPQRETRPFHSELITVWGQEVTAENAWTEYPRPQMERKQWTNLNGHWDYAITPIEQTVAPEAWAGKILVPFSLESKLGGVERLLDSGEALWYRREFSAAPQPNRRTLLHFEAVDYACEVFVNGQSVGSHQGGNDPFTLDISAAAQDGTNELLVRVQDATEGWQLNGKQSVNPRGIWYTQVSGIWQTVWLEQVPSEYIADLSIQTDADKGTITVTPTVGGDGQARDFRISVTNQRDWQVRSPGTWLVRATGNVESFELTIPDARLWSPASPHLYWIEVALLDAQENVLDEVRSYAGIRSVGKVRDAEGNWRFTLNGEVLFHWGPLDQGWWPDGLLTPPSDEAMLYDIEFLKSAGFNMIRKHIKVEPRRYYYHCDRLGMLVWQDQVSGGARPPWTRLAPNPQDAEWPTDAHEQFMLEFERMIDNLENHPSIVVWTPFNEAWGQHQTLAVGQWAAARDPSRLINIASGGNFWPVGDVVDHHSYPDPDFPFDSERFRDFIHVVGEFGGHGLPVEGHIWDANRRNWGYGGLPQDAAEYRQRYLTSLDKLNALRQRGIAAGVYTQTTDVEGEINGLMTYDRAVAKIPAEELAKLHARLFPTPKP